MKLIGAPLSPFVRKARIVAAEKGISYEYDPSVSPLNMPDNYDQIHPMRRIPALIVEEGHAKGIINDSSAICAYFDRLQPHPALMPADPFQYGRMLWIEEFSDSGFAESIGLGVFRPVLFNALSGKAPDIAAAQIGLEKLRAKHFAYLTQQLGDGEWFGGDQFTLADIAVGCNLVNLMHVGYQIKPSDGEGLATFFNRFLERESVAVFLDQERNALTKMGFSAPQL